MPSPKLKAIVEPETARFGDICPDCACFPVPNSALCACGYEPPLSLVLPYGLDWDYTDEMEKKFREYRGLRLMGKFRGRNPERIDCVSHVEYLYLSRYTGLHVSLLRGFNRLRVLELDYAPMSDLTGIGDLAALAVLELTECRKLSDISAIASIPTLIGLRITLCNRIEDYSPLEGLSDLRVLTIEANRLPSLSFLASMTSLQNVALPVGRLDDTQVPDLRPLTGLRRVTVPKRKWSTGLIEALGSQLPRCEVRTF